MTDGRLVFAVRSVDWSFHPPELTEIYKGQNMIVAFERFEEFSSVEKDVWVGLSLMQDGNSKTLMIRRGKEKSE